MSLLVIQFRIRDINGDDGDGSKFNCEATQSGSVKSSEYTDQVQYGF